MVSYCPGNNRSQLPHYDNHATIIQRCCQPPPRIWLIRKTSEALIQGHLGLAQIYDEIARSTKVEGDDILFREAAVLQRRLAEESKKITVPADMAEEMEKFDE